MTVTLPHVIELNGRWRASAPAIVTPTGVQSWSQFAAHVRQVASGLLAAGCGAGCRVGVVMDNVAEMVEVMFGAMAAGAVVVPLNTSVIDAALDAMLADAGVSAIFVSPPHRARLSATGVANARLCVVDGVAAEGWQSYRSWRDAQSAAAPSFALDPQAPCNIIYSSGTTGQPKGITHTLQGRFDWAHDLAHALRYTSAARTLIATGLYSNITWAGILPTFLLGGTIIVLPRFEAGEVLEAIARFEATHTQLVPVQLQRVLDHPAFAGQTLARMHMIMCCGAPLGPTLKAQIVGHAPHAFIELYGSTEGIITTHAPEDVLASLTSVGRPLPGEDVAILGLDDRVLPAGEAGEIVALSRFAMAGYWNNPAATEEAYWTDAQGRRWLRSGDIGRIDEMGFLYVTDRKKDMIISGGQNIYPADIEAVLLAHPDVAECAVFGVPSEAWGETPLAWVVRRSPGATAGELRDWANARLGRQQRIHALEFRDELLRNANGKLLKREMRARYWGGVSSA